VKINSKLPATAVRMSLNWPLTLCCLYLSPSLQWTLSDLIGLYDQLPHPVIFCGDFNAHSPVWGPQRLDAKGQIIEDLLTQTNLVLLNNGATTYIHPATGSQTAIDLMLCDTALALDFKWSILPDRHGSDHLPIILSSDISAGERLPQRWKLTKADWVHLLSYVLPS
jgi:hypothetical protein